MMDDHCCYLSKAVTVVNNFSKNLISEFFEDQFTFILMAFHFLQQEIQLAQERNLSVITEVNCREIKIAERTICAPLFYWFLMCCQSLLWQTSFNF